MQRSLSWRTEVGHPDPTPPERWQVLLNAPGVNVGWRLVKKKNDAKRLWVLVKRMFSNKKICLTFWKMEWLMESIQESGCFFLPLDFAWSIQAEREKLELLERLVGESCRFVLGKTFRRSAGLVVRNKEQPPLLWRYVWDILYIIICISFFLYNMYMPAIYTQDKLMYSIHVYYPVEQRS